MLRRVKLWHQICQLSWHLCIGATRRFRHGCRPDQFLSGTPWIGGSRYQCDWFTTSSPNAKDPHPIANGRRPHLFTTQLLLNRNPSNQSFPNAGHGKRLWLKRYSPPLPPFADHSSNVCGNMNMGSHECMTGDLMVEQGRKLLEIHNICIYMYIYMYIYCIYMYIYICI